MSRRDARRHAFILIFQFPFHTPYDAAVLREAYSFYTEDLPEPERPTGRDKAYIVRVTAGTLEKLPQIDGVIENYLKDWQIDRINKVDLALLRLGVCELLRERDIPTGVTINEAVELAKQYGADESAAFVNGVLGGISRTLDERERSQDE